MSVCGALQGSARRRAMASPLTRRRVPCTPAADIRLVTEGATFCVKVRPGTAEGMSRSPAHAHAPCNLTHPHPYLQEADLAITADMGTLQRLPSIVGHGVAAELALTARDFSGAAAAPQATACMHVLPPGQAALPCKPLSTLNPLFYRAGTEAKSLRLVSHTYPDREALLAGALAMARGIAAKSPLAVVGTKRVLLFQRWMLAIGAWGCCGAPGVACTRRPTSTPLSSHMSVVPAVPRRDHSVRDGLDYVAAFNAAVLPQSADIREVFQARAERRRPIFSRL